MADSDTKPVAAKPAVVAKKKSSGKVKAKNIRKSPLCTANGIIEPGKVGVLTAAEARQFHKYVEVEK